MSEIVFEQVYHYDKTIHENPQNNSNNTDVEYNDSITKKDEINKENIVLFKSYIESNDISVIANIHLDNVTNSIEANNEKMTEHHEKLSKDVSDTNDIDINDSLYNTSINDNKTIVDFGAVNAEQDKLDNHLTKEKIIHETHGSIDYDKNTLINEVYFTKNAEDSIINTNNKKHLDVEAIITLTNKVEENPLKNALPRHIVQENRPVTNISHIYSNKDENLQLNTKTQRDNTNVSSSKHKMQKIKTQSKNTTNFSRKIDKKAHNFVITHVSTTNEESTKLNTNKKSNIGSMQNDCVNEIHKHSDNNKMVPEHDDSSTTYDITAQTALKSIGSKLKSFMHRRKPNIDNNVGDINNDATCSHQTMIKTTGDTSNKITLENHLENNNIDASQITHLKAINEQKNCDNKHKSLLDAFKRKISKRKVFKKKLKTKNIHNDQPTLSTEIDNTRSLKASASDNKINVNERAILESASDNNTIEINDYDNLSNTNNNALLQQKNNPEVTIKVNLLLDHINMPQEIKTDNEEYVSDNIENTNNSKGTNIPIDSAKHQLHKPIESEYENKNTLDKKHILQYNSNFSTEVVINTVIEGQNDKTKQIEINSSDYDYSDLNTLIYNIDKSNANVNSPKHISNHKIEDKIESFFYT